MAGIRRLNHAVLYVADVERSIEFYAGVLDFQVRGRLGATAAFLAADGSNNDHDLGLFQIGQRRPANNAPIGSGPAIGLYHLAWQVDTIEELVAVRQRLVDARSLVGESDHGVSKSLYARDPDGIEFEIMWAVPRGAWDGAAGVAPLDLNGESARWAAVSTAAEANVD